MPRLLLASASPRRQELLASMGIPFEIVVSNAEEIESGAPDKLVLGNARIKGLSVAREHRDAVILAADTIVYFNHQVLGKPKDKAEAERMIRMLSGAWHEVYTGVFVTGNGREESGVSVSRVQFDRLTDEEVRRYVETGEPMDKAGAYAIQGRAGMFIDRIEGSYSNVIGLPMALVRQMLIRQGFIL